MIAYLVLFLILVGLVFLAFNFPTDENKIVEVEDTDKLKVKEDAKIKTSEENSSDVSLSAKKTKPKKTKKSTKKKSKRNSRRDL